MTYLASWDNRPRDVAPAHRPQEHRRRQRNAILQTDGHHLVDPQSRQRPAEPRHERHAHDSPYTRMLHIPREIAEVPPQSGCGM